MRTTRLGTALLLALAPSSLLHAQQPVNRDTTKVIEVAPLTVTVTRTAEPLSKVPAAVGVLNAQAVRRGQATVGLDEALSNLPGVYVANRYNFSVDQRLSIRGAGARASFGARGVKILLDGVPQTLPDGQSQLTNVDLSTIDRIEVLRGASSALYGNAAGGVISLTSLPTAPDPLGASARYEAGSFGLRKGQIRLSGRSGAVSGAVSFSRTTVDGFRQQSRFEGNSLNAALDWFAGASTSVGLRYAEGDQPVAENPGALNAGELAANRDSAPANNITRDATKDVLQRQLSATVHHYLESGAEFSITTFYFARTLDNPLATNNWNLIDRVAGGVRAQGSKALGGGARAPKLIAGIDYQALRDDRRNYTPVPAVGPVTDTTIQQREQVTEVGPFVQLNWPAASKVLVNGGVRYDAVTFKVTDEILSDGDNSGQRTMSSFSGGAAVSFDLGRAFVPYLNASTGFETPTTTELAVTLAGGGGFNDSLAPQRALSFEVGGRGAVGNGFSWSLALFTIGIKDALVPYAESGGRSFFRNAGETRNKGYELGLTWRPLHGVTLQGAWTHADYRFTDYVAITNAGVDTTVFTGKRTPGVPGDFVRLGLRSVLPGGFWLDLDHTLSSEQYADDANTLRVDGWGAGVSNVRIGWDGTIGGMHATPFAAANNLWDKEYVGSVTVNGFGGRVFEPSPRRNYYFGVELGWAKR
jgi:iron complex outermembrane receptor protein